MFTRSDKTVGMTIYAVDQRLYTIYTYDVHEPLPVSFQVTREW